MLKAKQNSILSADQSFFLVGALVLTLSVSQQSFSAQTRDKLWSLVTLNGENNRIVYTVEPQLRLVTPGILFQQFLANTGIGYKMDSNWQLWLGQTFSTDSQDAVPGSADEYRFWQQIIWKHQWTKLGILSRTRLEERNSLNFSPVSFRLRERLVVNKPLTENISLVVYDEAFINLKSTYWIVTKTFDQNRAYFGIEQRVSKLSYLGAGYMNQFLSTTPSQLDNVMVISWRIELNNK